MDLGVKYDSFEKGFDFVIEEATKYLGDQKALVSYLEILACTIAHKDTNTCLKAGAQKRFRVQDVTLKICGQGCRSHPLGPLTRQHFLGGENQPRTGRSRNTCTTIIPWDMLQDFVVVDQSMRDFSYTFNEVHKLGHKEGIAENAKKLLLTKD